MIDVRVQIDQPRRDILAAGIDHARCRLGRDITIDCGDAIALDRHIQPAILPAARIDDLAAFD